MKGFFAFILDALRDVDVAKLKKPLYILATVNEETSMVSARYFAETTQLRVGLRHYRRTDFAAAGTRAQRPYLYCRSRSGAV